MQIIRKRKSHTYRIDYTIMIEGDSYPKSIEMPGYDEDDARKRWEKHRDGSFTDEQYIFVSATQIR